MTSTALMQFTSMTTSLESMLWQHARTYFKKTYYLDSNDYFPCVTSVALLPTATWALIPLCGLRKKLSLVRVVLQLLEHTVGVKGEHRSRSLGLEGEVRFRVRGGT